jgi:hypothetical protein
VCNSSITQHESSIYTKSGTSSADAVQQQVEQAEREPGSICPITLEQSGFNAQILPQTLAS